MESSFGKKLDTVISVHVNEVCIGESSTDICISNNVTSNSTGQILNPENITANKHGDNISLIQSRSKAVTGQLEKSCSHDITQTEGNASSVLLKKKDVMSYCDDDTCNKLLDKDISFEFSEYKQPAMGPIKKNPPIIMKNVTRCNTRESSLSSAINVGTLARVKNFKKYPRISVRKKNQGSGGNTKKGIKIRPKLRAADADSNTHHSAKCLKNGKSKCDYVCNLYSSGSFSLDNTSAIFKTSKVNSKKVKSESTVINPINTSAEEGTLPRSRLIVDNACTFCEKMFDWEEIMWLSLDVPLPSSFLNPLALLRHYGVHFPFPLHEFNRKNDSSVVNVCQTCYDLVMDGDLMLQKIKAVASQMKQSWPKQIKKEDSLLLMTDFVLEDDIDYSFHDSNQINRRQFIGGKELPYILPASSAEGGPQSTRGKFSKVEGATKTKVDSCKPNKVRLKPITCGLCGVDFFTEDLWEQHMGNYHKVLRKWQRFTPNMHFKLRTNILDELTKTVYKKAADDHSSDQKSTFTCHACEDKFMEHSMFIYHLRNYHKMIVDDCLLESFQSNSDLQEDNVVKKHAIDLPCHSKMISEVNQILGNYDDKESVRSVGDGNKTLEDSERDVSGILGMNEYENECIGSDAVLLNNSYCGNTSTLEDSQIEKDLEKNNSQNETSEESAFTVFGVVCQICNARFKSKKELKNHLETFHISSVILKGDGSGGVVDYIVNVQDSCLPSSKEPEDHSLTLEESITKASELMEWQRENVLNSPFVTEEKESLVEASKEKGEDVPQCLVFECEICGRRIKGKKLLHNHLRKVHDMSIDLQDDGALHYCKLCLFRSGSRNKLEKHRKEQHGTSRGSNQQQCETCGKFYSSLYIQEHVAVMHGKDRKYTCEFCGMKFFDKKGVKNHIYFEHANKQWKCEKCSVTFEKYYQLRQHNIYVHSTTEYKCEQCSKSFKRKGDLTQHVKRAHEKTIYVCSYCSRQYRNSHKFRNHLINVHGVSREETYSDRYARHKRANNRFPSRVGKAIEPATEKVLIPESDEMQEACLEIERSEAEFEFVEVKESSRTDVDEVTVLILS